MGEDLSDQLSYAKFTPAIQSPYAQFTQKAAEDVRQMPGGLVPADLDFLSRNSNLFHFPAALYSVGQFTYNEMANPKPCMVLNRNRDETFILGDSGGFQVLTGNLKVGGDDDRKTIFDWLDKHTDLAMTLDVPTKFAKDYEQFKECLDDTLENLEYWRTRYPDGQDRGPFLNVLQGGEPAWMVEWDDLATDDEYKGFAIAGNKRKNPYYVLQRLLKLTEKGKLDERQFWVHFLGAGDLTTACLLTAIQNNMSTLLGNEDFHISFDASNPFYLLGRFRQVYTGYDIKKSGLRLRTEVLDTDNSKFVDSSEPFPHADESPIGSILTMGDLIVNRPRKGVGLDDVADYMLMNHNVYVHMKGVIEANRLFAANYNTARHYFPVAMLEAREAIREIVRAENQFSCLEKHKKLLTAASTKL